MAKKALKRQASTRRPAPRRKPLPSPRDETPIYFSGSSAGPDLQPQVPISLAREYVPLDSMDVHARRQAFGLWLGIVYLNGTDDYKYLKGTAAADDPLLVFQFQDDYAAGAWRKLDRGLTLQEMALASEFMTGEGVMTFINSNGPAFSTPRVTRKMMIDADAILELVTINFALKGSGRRRPVATLFYDGKIGHCITLLDVAPDGKQFAYYDPWPGRSLLCAENNAAGVAAADLGKTKIHLGEKSVEIPVWGVTREELARVIVASLVMLTDWSPLMMAMVSGAFSPRLRQQVKAGLVAQADAAEAE